MDYQYLVCLGTEGFEALIDITDLGPAVTAATLTGEITSQIKAVSDFFQIMPLRIRLNSHRHIKTYHVSVPYNEDEFRDMLCVSRYLCDFICKNIESVNLSSYARSV